MARTEADLTAARDAYQEQIQEIIEKQEKHCRALHSLFDILKRAEVKLPI